MFYDSDLLLFIMTCVKFLESFTASILMQFVLSVLPSVSADAVCENLPIVSNGQLILEGRGPPFMLNENISYKCNEDFISDQRNPQVSCILRGDTANWTDTEGVCKPVCENLPLLNNGQFLLDGREPPFMLNENISYKCNEDFKSDQRNPKITCILQGNSANWTDTEEACKPIVKSCHDPGFIENADRIGNLYTFPNNITYICKEGYRMEGIGTKFCSSKGHWIPPRMPFCEAILCPALNDPQNGKVLFSNRRLNSVATYNCDRNFKLSGSTVRICQADGTWNGSNAACKAITCSHPGVPKNGRILGRDNGIFYASEIVIFQCNDGDGHVTSKCLENGEWSSRHPVCPDTDEPTTEAPDEGEIKEVNSCEDPGKIKHGDRVFVGLHINSTMTYTCDEGYELRGKSTLLCLESGKWDLDKLPICMKPLGVPAIIGIVFGVIISIIVGVGAYLWYKYRMKSLRGYGKKSKALTADATDIEEISSLERDRKKIPVTVL